MNTITPVFDEREAIRQELQAVKDQNRMDYDLYLESRKIRNDRTIELLDRLRELDGVYVPKEPRIPKRELELQEELRRFKEEWPKQVLPTIEEPKPEPVPEPEPPVEKLREVKPTKTTVEKARDHSRNNEGKKKKVFVPLERLAPIVTAYLIENGPSRPVHIQKHVEELTGGKWANFTNPMVRLGEINSKIKRAERGLYMYDDSPKEEPKEDTTEPFWKGVVKDDNEV